MRTCRTAIFRQAGEPLRLATVPVPKLGRGQILVRNLCTTLCRSDLNTYAGKRLEKVPTILGHEIVGRIEEFGPGAPLTDSRGAGLAVGDRITWAIYASDPCCARARRGIPQKGQNLFKYGHEQITPESNLHGGLSEYCILRQHTPILRIDPKLPLRVAALINCSVSTVSGSLRVSGGVHGRSVIIVGTGMLGIIACAMCQVEGASRIFAIDIHQERLEKALEFGATNTGLLHHPLGGSSTDEAFTEERAAAVFDFSGNPMAMEQGLRMLDVGGSAVWVGATSPQRKLQISAETIVRNVQTIKGLHNYNQEDFVHAVNFMEQHSSAFPFESLIHGWYTLESVNEAFTYAMESNVHRVAIRLTDNG